MGKAEIRQKTSRLFSLKCMERGKKETNLKTDSESAIDSTVRTNVVKKLKRVGFIIEKRCINSIVSILTYFENPII